METGKTLKGGTQLVFDSVAGVTGIVEGMYRNISALPFPVGPEPSGSARGIAGLVYRCIQLANTTARGITGAVLSPLTDYIDQHYPPGPYRQAIVAVLNGIVGDHLAVTANPLSIPLRFRVYLPALPQEAEASNDEPSRFAHLFESKRRACEVYPQADASADPDFSPGGKLLICAHGLCMNDMEWTSHGHNHGHMLAERYGYTPVFAHYNSGRHISENGRELAYALDGLIARWPVPVETVTLLGFSMGGLAFRSALEIARLEDLSWPQKVGKAAYVGTPHHGSALERGGYWLQKSATFSPYTAPLAALGKIRSAGITDLRHGNILDEDWSDVDVHSDNRDHRMPVPLAEGIAHYAIAASLSADASQAGSDGLVHPDSGLGRHDDPRFTLAFDADKQRLIPGLGHLTMLNDQRVASQLMEWLAPIPQAQ